MWRRKVGTVAALAASAAALSGCVVFKAQPTAKQKKNSVVITVKGCASQKGSGAPPGSCPNFGKSNSPAGPLASQVLLGFRVPADSKAPKSFTAATGPASGAPKLSFTPSASYKQQLQSLAPAPSGEKWVGYWTTYFNYSTTGQQNFTAKVAFGLQKATKGMFKYEVVIGGRANGNPSPNPTEPVNCNGSLTTLNTTGGEHLICVDDSAVGSLKLR